MANALLTFWVNALWQVTLIFLLGAMSARLLRRASAALEYRAWVAVLIGACIVPMLSLLAFRNSATVAHSWAWRSQTAADFGLWISGGAVNGAEGVVAPFAWRPVWTVIAAVYSLYVAAQLARVLYGWLYMRRKVMRSSVCHSFPLTWLHPDLQRRLSGTGCTLRISDSAPLPFAFGWRQPSIVVPRSLVDSGDGEKLTVVLAHELAHVERRDWIVNLLLLVLSTPLNLHPCMALIRKRVEACCEAACDELAAGSMTSRLQYGRALLDLAGTFAKQQLPLDWVPDAPASFFWDA